MPGISGDWNARRDEAFKKYFFLEILSHPRYLINHLPYSKDGSKYKED
jgi:hypothetical protein